MASPTFPKNISQSFGHFFSSNLFLFFTCAGIWGSTWIVIKYQLIGPDPVVSVLYRFVISTTLMFLFTYFMQQRLRYPIRYHWVFLFQGTCNFSINYIFTYWAEQHAPSALVATTFTLLVAYNIIGMKVFYKKKIQPMVYLGAFLGIIGVIFIFSNELSHFKNRSSNIMGLAFGLIATFFASSGNILAYKNHLNKVPVSAATFWGMFYGTLVTLFLALVQNREFTFHFPPTYWLSLLYLSIFGTVIAFGAYFTLVGRIGAERAGYTSILSPVIAVILSMLLENLQLTSYLVIGLLFCLFGNFITLRSKNNPSSSS